MRTVGLQNLGCTKNIIDGERILTIFKDAGFTITEDLHSAEIIVVNTCAFIREAQEEAIETILESAAFRKGGNCKTLIVSGCFSERYRDKVRSEFPEVDLWVGVNDWNRILSTLLGTPSSSEFKRVLAEPITTQHLKIAEGCSHGCTFCVIPSIRGPFISRTIPDLLQEAHWLYEQGTRELILVAQDTSFYGRDRQSNLCSLLEQLLTATRFNWIRMMYLHPNFIDDPLLSLIASEPRLCPYFDMPLQHISDSILSEMNRRHSSKDAYALIDKIRTMVPDAAIRSSFIVGFPGETKREFKELVEFVEYARFDKLGVFPYSPEEGTKAFGMKGRPRIATAAARSEELMLIQRDISREKMEQHIGKNMEILIERISEDPDFNFEGRTRFDAPEVDGRVFIAKGSFLPGSFVEATIIGSNDYDLYAEPVH